MKSSENLNDELGDLSPLLRDLRERPGGFNVPAGYFDQFETSVYQRLDAKGVERHGIQLSPGKSLKAILFRPRTMMAIAACLTLTLSAWWFFSPQSATSAPAVASTELTDEDLEGYMIDHIHEFDAEQLASLPDADVAEVDETPAPAASQHPQTKTTPGELSPDDIEDLLKDMSDDELEQLL
jgi:hypothetical protein